MTPLSIKNKSYWDFSEKKLNFELKTTLNQKS